MHPGPRAEGRKALLDAIFSNSFRGRWSQRSQYTGADFQAATSSFDPIAALALCLRRRTSPPKGGPCATGQVSRGPD